MSSSPTMDTTAPTSDDQMDSTLAVPKMNYMAMAFVIHIIVVLVGLALVVVSMFDGTETGVYGLGWTLVVLLLIHAVVIVMAQGMATKLSALAIVLALVALISAILHHVVDSPKSNAAMAGFVGGAAVLSIFIFHSKASTMQDVRGLARNMPTMRMPQRPRMNWGGFRNPFRRAVQVAAAAGNQDQQQQPPISQFTCPPGPPGPPAQQAVTSGI